jgi:hypothetical protein
MAPGSTLRDLAGRVCKDQTECPSAAYLAGLGVYLTSSREVTISSLPELSGTNLREPHSVHTVSIVLINAAGRRINATSWQSEFRA